MGSSTDKGEGSKESKAQKMAKAKPIRPPSDQEKEVLRGIERAKHRPNEMLDLHGWKVTMKHRARIRGKNVGSLIKVLSVVAPDGTKLSSKLGVQRHMGILEGSTGTKECVGGAKKERKTMRAKKQKRRERGGYRWKSRRPRRGKGRRREEQGRVAHSSESSRFGRGGARGQTRRTPLVVLL